MTPDQFAALAQLLRMQDGPSLIAARLVLVDRVQQSEAAAIAGITRGGASHAVSRMRSGMDLARRAVKPAKETQ